MIPIMTKGYVFAAALAASGSACLGQSSFLWTGNAFNSNWSDQQNWSNLTMGGIVSGFPSLLDDVLFQSNAGVGSGDAGQLAIDPGVTLTLGQGSSSSLRLGTALTNNGTLTFIEDNTNNLGGTVDQRLFIDNAAVSFMGAGSVVFNGPETGIEGSGRASATLTINNGQDISSAGVIEDLTVINNGGSIRASADSLVLRNTDFSGGSICIEPAGVLRLENTALLRDTTIAGQNGSAFNSDSNPGTVARNITTTGDIRLGAAGSSTSSLTIETTLTNNATLTFTPDSTNNLGGTIDQRLFINGGGVTIDGNGSIVFSGPETGIEGNGRATTTLTINSGQDLSGAGVLEDLTVISNNASIRADADTLVLRNADFTGGILIESGGVLLLGNGTLVHDATITGVAGSALQTDSSPGVRLLNIDTHGEIGLGEPGSSSNSITIEGTLNNLGTLRFNEDNTNNLGGAIDQRLFIASGSSADIIGNGSIVLNGIETGIEGDGRDVSTLTLNNGQTVSGSGVVEDLTITNTGATVRADDGTLILRDVDYAGGTIGIEGDGVLRLERFALLHDTLLDGQPGSSLEADTSNGSVLRDLTTTGEITIGSIGSSSNSVTIEGTIANNAILRFNEDNTNNLGGAIDQRVFIDSTAAAIIGSGSVVLNGNETGFQGDDALASTITFGPDQLISGSGAFEDIVVINRGTIDPASSARVIEFRDNDTELRMEPQARLVVDLGGAVNGSFDRIELSDNATATLDGTLTISIEAGYVPAFGQTWDIISGPTTGTFSEVITATAPFGQVYRAIYENSRVYVILTCDADLSGDGTIDFFDVSEFLSYFSSQDVRGDLNNDGAFNFFDISVFLQLYSQGCNP